MTTVDFKFTLLSISVFITILSLEEQVKPVSLFPSSVAEADWRIRFLKSGLFSKIICFLQLSVIPLSWCQI